MTSATLTGRQEFSSPLAGEEGARREAVGRRGGKHKLLPLAKRMRREPTDAERKMWSILRAKRLGGLKFKRQQQIGEYIVDFVCFGSRLIVEVDGGQHSDSASDAERDAWLTSQEFSVLRFWNNEVLTNPQGVAERVLEAALAASPTPTRRQAAKSAYPLRQAERKA